MVATNSDMTYHLSGGASNTDPNASLGGARSTVGGGALHDVESTFTAWEAVGGFRLFDSVLGGSDGDHDGKFLLIMEGGIALYAAKVLNYRAGDGRFYMDTPLPGSAGAVTYRLFPKNNLFDDVTPTQSAFGTTEYRAIYLLNNNVVDAFSPQSFFITRLDKGPIELEIYCSDTQAGFPVLPTIVDAEVGPTASQLTSINANGRFSSPLNFSIGELQSPNVDFPIPLDNDAHRGFFVRRLVPADQQARASVAFMIVAEGTSSGQKQSGCIIHFDVDGFTLDTAGVTFDRTVKINGGARVAVVARSVEKGDVVEGLSVSYRLLSGPGTLTVGGDFQETDKDGRSFAAYAAPTDQGQAGQVVTVEVRI